MQMLKIVPPGAGVRRRRTAIGSLLILLLGMLSSSCRTTRLPPISALGAAFEPLADELDLWQEARAEEDQLLSNLTLYDNRRLNDYLAAVVERLNPASMAHSGQLQYRVTVVEDPTLNAFAYPHGSIYLHTGLLSRIENEDQLATVLGHEMTHVENRHMVRYQRGAQNREIGWSLAGIAAAILIAGETDDKYRAGNWGRAAVVGVLADVMLSLGLHLAVRASVQGYGRELELEADQGGFAKLAQAGYDPGEAAVAYRLLANDHGDSRAAEGFFFGSHPKLARRIANAEAWAATTQPPQPAIATSSDEFEQLLLPLVRDDAALNLVAGRWQLARAQLQRVLRGRPDDPGATQMLGCLDRATADATTSEQSLDECLAHADALSQPSSDAAAQPDGR